MRTLALVGGTEPNISETDGRWEAVSASGCSLDLYLLLRYTSEENPLSHRSAAV